jgi:hypothetical protein
MRRYAILALVVLLAVLPMVAQATAGDAVITWQAKVDLGDGNTAPLRGYVRWATVGLFSGFSAWHTTYLDTLGMASIMLPLPVYCWDGTDQCFTVDGQWLYWTVVPWAFGTCLPLNPPSSEMTYSGVDWIDGHPMSMGFIYQGDCVP